MLLTVITLPLSPRCTLSNYVNGRRNAWIGTEIRPWAGTSRKHLSIPERTKRYFSSPRPPPPSAHTDPEVQLASYLIVSASFVTGQKRRGFDADHSAHYSADVKNKRSRTAGPAVSHGVHTDIVKFAIKIKGHIKKSAIGLLLECSSSSSSSSSCSLRFRHVSCSLVLKMKLVPPSLPRSSYVSSSFWFIL